MKKKVAAITISLLLAGCASTNPSRYKNETNAVDMSGAYQLVTRDDFEDIDLVGLVDPKGEAAKASNWKDLNAGQKIDAALNQFYVGKSAAQQRTERDRIQERLLSASTQRCNAFKQNLQREYSRHNFLLGLGSTLSGVVGAVVPGVQASKNLAAAAGIFSGARAEWNQDYLSNVAVNVIVDGIELRQREIYNQLVLAGQEKDISRYNLEAAIKDALFFHGQCSIITGLRAASDSIKLANDPGIDAATRMMLKINNLKKAADGGAGMDTDLPKKLNDLSITTNLLVGTPRANPPEPSSLLRSLASLQLNIKLSSDQFISALETIEGTKNTPAQQRVKDIKDKLIGGTGVFSKCQSTASTILNKTLDLQAQLDNASGEADKITLAGDIDTQNKLATAIAVEAEQRYGSFTDALRKLKDQISAKTLKDTATATASVTKELGDDLKTPLPLCN